MESIWRKYGINSRAAALLGELGGELSSRISLMRLSYDISTVVLEYRRITYGGDVFPSDDMELCSKGSVDGEGALLSIGDTGMGIFLMVP